MWVFYDNALKRFYSGFRLIKRLLAKETIKEKRFFGQKCSFEDFVTDGQAIWLLEPIKNSYLIIK